MKKILTFYVTAFCAIQAVSCEDPIVTVVQGKLRGKQQEGVTGGVYYSFENIPFAKPPVGWLRFKAPEQPEPWEGTRDATALGPMCPQYNPLIDTHIIGSEDCLTCNVYSPDLTGNLPVFFFISGFAFSFDADYVDLYGPDFLVKKAVVVKCNHRLDALGFLSLDTQAVPGNAGLKDQVAAMRWVRDNINQFGGDPSRVTLAGISSGSASIFYHMMSPMSTGLFHRAILLSGVPSYDAIYPYEVQNQSQSLGRHLGFHNGNQDHYLIELQSFPYRYFIGKSYSLCRYDPTCQLFKKMAVFLPVAEQDFGQERFLTDLNGDLVNKVKVLIAYSNQESLIVVNQYAEYLIDLYKYFQDLFVPNKILYKATSEEIKNLSSIIKNHYLGDKAISVENIKEFLQCTSLSNMIYDVLKTAKEISQEVDTYMFKFSSYSDRNIYGKEGEKYGVPGAAHGDILAYLFHMKPLNLTVDVNSLEYAMIEQLVNAVTSFAESGEPDAGDISPWPKFTLESMEYVEFTDKITLKKNPEEEDYEFWQSIYDYELNEGLH